MKMYSPASVAGLHNLDEYRDDARYHNRRASQRRATKQLKSAARQQAKKECQRTSNE